MSSLSTASWPPRNRLVSPWVTTAAWAAAPLGWVAVRAGVSCAGLSADVSRLALT